MQHERQGTGQQAASGGEALHVLLHVTAPLPCHLGKVIAGFKTGCNKGYRLLAAPQHSCTAPDTPPASSPFPSSPSPATSPFPGSPSPASSSPSPSRRVRCPAAPPQGSAPGLLWEPGYHDRLLSGAHQLQTLIDYIHDNPRRLLIKRSHSGLFRVRSIAVGDCTLQAVGNLALLRGPRRIAVRLSRRLTPADIAAEVQRLLAEARAGAVLVSPFISPGERAVRDAALAEALPMIRLLENGFPPLYKPSGTAFEACANGRLLLLSPWPYHTQRTTITRDQCQQLNVLAAKIAAG